MQAEYTPNNNDVVIELLRTPVESGENENPIYGEGRIKLTSYGARKLAYSLLNAATDLEHYRKNLY